MTAPRFGAAPALGILLVLKHPGAAIANSLLAHATGGVVYGDRVLGGLGRGAVGNMVLLVAQV